MTETERETERELITIGGRKTYAHFRALSEADAVRLAPATHQGACIAIKGVEVGMTFTYDNRLFEVNRAWDESVKPQGDQNAKRAPLDANELEYHRSRVGKFLDLLVIDRSERALQ